MTCRSGSVQTAADKTVAAGAQIDKLQKMIEAQDGANKAKFLGDISSHLAAAKVADAREISYSSDIKTEYTSEFSLDKIAAVITSALKALAAAKDPTVVAPALSPEAIAAYTDVVNTVAEAAKSTSTASASLSFSMNRLSPGLFAFLSASSVNISDEDTFGTEAVTTTAIYYRFMQSIDDVKNQAAFGAAILDAKSYLNMKTLQAALVDELANGKITIDVWQTKDNAYLGAVEKLRLRLEAARFNAGNAVAGRMANTVELGSSKNQTLVTAAIETLAAKGDAFRVAVQTSKTRLASVYY
jgi:hypothetical protein